MWCDVRRCRLVTAVTSSIIRPHRESREENVLICLFGGVVRAAHGRAPHIPGIGRPEGGVHEQGLLAEARRNAGDVSRHTKGPL